MRDLPLVNDPLENTLPAAQTTFDLQQLRLTDNLAARASCWDSEPLGIGSEVVDKIGKRMV